MWTDPSSNMAYGANQWMNPAHYKNMTNEQVDWASLAQQWIKMKETTPGVPPGQQVRPSTISCEPSNLLAVSSGQSVDPKNFSNATVPNKMLSDHNISRPIVENNVEKPSAWNTWTWQQQQQWNWNWASSSTVPPPTKAPVVESVNPIRPPYVVPPILTEPPPSFPVISPNKQFSANNFWVGPNTKIPPPVEPEQWNKPNIMISNMDDKSLDPSYIDAAKRKQLPAWIREGLEKMEREKRRKVEREHAFDESDYSNLNNENVSRELHHSPNNFDHETQMADDEVDHDSSDYINDTESRKTEFVKNDLPPLIPRKTKAQIWEDTMLSLRQVLTKLLMEVTNDMMLSVAKEVLKTTLQTDIQRNQNQTSLAGKLGLGVYGSASDSSDNSDEEQHIVSGRRQVLKQDSDEAIQERILKRQREFSNIEARILMELDQLEDREKLVRSKFDTSVKLSGDINDNGSQVVENIHTKGRTEDEGSSQKLVDKGHDKTRKDQLANEFNSKNGHKKKKFKKRSSSSTSSSSSSSSDSKMSDDSKYSYKKNYKTKSKSLKRKNKADVAKRKRRSLSRNRSRSRSKRHSRSHSRRRSSSRSRRNDHRRSPHGSGYRMRRSRSPVSRHGSHRKYKSKRNSSSSSNESRSTKHRYRR